MSTYRKDVIEFLETLVINPKGKEFTNEESWELYKHLVARDGNKLYKNII